MENIKDRNYRNTFHTGINDDVTDGVFRPFKNYTGNALSDTMKKQLGANFEDVDYADTLGMAIPAKNTESFNIYTDRELVGGVTTVTPYDKINPNSFNAVISQYEPSKANTLISGVVDLRRFTNMCLKSDSASMFTGIGPRGQADVTKKIPCNGGYGATLNHNIMKRKWGTALIDVFGHTVNISCTLVFEE